MYGTATAHCLFQTKTITINDWVYEKRDLRLVSLRFLKIFFLSTGKINKFLPIFILLSFLSVDLRMQGISSVLLNF
jgi:hypothetical protein